MREPLAEFVFLAAATASSVISSMTDLRQRRIPNVVTATSLCLALLVHFLLGGWTGTLIAASAGIAVGTATLLFYLLRALGAGDVKLMAAVACWVGFRVLPQLVLGIAIASLIWSVAVLLRTGRLRQLLPNVIALVRHHRRNGLRPHTMLNIESAGAVSIPFAVPIACGCIFALCQQLWSDFL